MDKVEVSASALRELLSAIAGPPHLIRELQVIRGLPGSDNPINTLINEFNECVEAFNAKAAGEE